MKKNLARLASFMMVLAIFSLAFMSVQISSVLNEPILSVSDSSYKLSYELNLILNEALYGIQTTYNGNVPLEYYIVAHKYDNQYYRPRTSADEETLTIVDDQDTVTNFLTSKRNIRRFDPLSLSLDDYEGKNVVLVQGKYTMEDGVDYRIGLTDPGNGELEKYGHIMDELIPEVFDIDDEYGIIELTFAYILDIDSPGFKSFLDYYEINRTTIPNLIILGILSILFISLISLSVEFEYSEFIGFFKWLKMIPIEFIGFLQIFWMVLLEWIYYYRIESYDKATIYIIAFILIVLIQILFVYYSLAIKSFFLKGAQSHVLTNSLAIKLIKSLRKLVIKTIEEILSLADKVGSKALLYMTLSLFLVSLILLALGFISPLVFIISLGLILAIYVFFRSFFDEVQDIEHYSKEISLGNYDVNIDQEDSYFKEISYNLSSIRDNLNLAVEEAVKSERTKSELITNVSHDLKTPLTSILNYSQLMEDEEDLETLKSYGRVIHERSNRLKVLIDDLFELTKANTENLEFEYTDIDFGQLIHQVIGEWEDKLSEKGLSVNLNLPEEKIILSLDGNKTFRILDNLLSNIYKYSMENTRVYIDLKVKDNLTLEMKNISKYPLNITSEELMERFTRGDKSRNTEGSGLGLAIAKSLVEAQRGEFQVFILGDLYMASITFPYKDD